MPGARRYASAEAELWRYPLAGPTGGSGITAVDVIVVSLEDSEGETGTGFSYVLGGGGAVVKAAAGDLLARFVAGEDCAPPETLWRRLAGSLNRVGRGIGYVAIAAIDVAAWDLHACAMGVPLYTALGGAARTVPVYGSGGFRPDQDPESAVAQALAYAGRGCKAVKLRLAGNRADAPRMRAVAAALPGGVDLMVDANERCDLARAIWLANECAAVNALWLEEPLPADALHGYAALAKKTSIAIATGEHLQGAVEVKPYLAADACAVLQPDLAMMGGISECLRAGRIAEYHDVSVSPHFLPALFVHLACALPNIGWLEDFPLLEPLFDSPVAMDENGTMTPGDAPSHGLAWASGARDAWRVAE